jgi:hypothetical protein
MTRPTLFREVKISPKIIRIAVMMDVRFPLCAEGVQR